MAPSVLPSRERNLPRGPGAGAVRYPGARGGGRVVWKEAPASILHAPLVFRSESFYFSCASKTVHTGNQLLGLGRLKRFGKEPECASMLER